MDLLFFGCWDQPGHYLFGPHGHHADERTLPESLRLHRLDGQLAPKDPRETEGRASVHHIDGWTVVAWWDRSADKRMGSNSALVMRGTHSLLAVLLAAADRFPELLPRFATLTPA